MVVTFNIPAPKTENSIPDPVTKRFVTPVIPLERPARKEATKYESLSSKLRSNPTDKGSTNYEITVPYFAAGTPEEVLNFIRDVKKVISGQNVTTGPQMYALLHRLLQGDALAAFDRAAATRGSETATNFNMCVKDLITPVFPRRALATQKRYMRRHLRKPRSMKMREFMV